MKLWRFHLVAALVSGLSIYGCGGDDDDTTSGTGAHAGTSSAGKGGHAGTGGKGGSAGKGSSGEAGQGASGGTTSAGGNGGESATAGTGNSGEGGAGGEAGAAAVDVTGDWRIEEVIPPGPAGGTYLATFTLSANGDAVTGNALWDSGLASVIVGSVHGHKIHLDRTDPSGFRASFDGTIAASGDAMSGTGKNDPTSPGGNDSTYTWSGTRGDTGGGGTGAGGAGDSGSGGTPN